MTSERTYINPEMDRATWGPGPWDIAAMAVLDRLGNNATRGALL